MNKKPEIAQNRRRRRPKQERSKVTVDAILTATAQVLRNGGYRRLTARAIADRAGVSVGSLYQYFPSKEAVVRALADHRRTQLVGMLREVLKGTEGRTLPERSRLLVEAFLAARSDDIELAARLTGAMLEIEGPCYLTQNSEPYRAIVLDVLAPARNAPDLELTSFVIVRALEGVLSGVGTTGELFDQERLTDTITRLVLGVVEPYSAQA